MNLQEVTFAIANPYVAEVHMYKNMQPEFGNKNNICICREIAIYIQYFQCYKKQSHEIKQSVFRSSLSLSKTIGSFLQPHFVLIDF